MGVVRSIFKKYNQQKHSIPSIISNERNSRALPSTQITSSDERDLKIENNFRKSTHKLAHQRIK